MKKLVLLAVFTSALMAADNGWYIGIDTYKTRSDITVTNGAATDKQNLTRNSKTLKAGYYLSKQGRANIFYQRSDTMDDTKGSLYGAGYDYLIGDYALKPYVGVLLGYSKYSQPNLTMDGNFIGANMGLNYAFGEKFSIEGGYRYMHSNASGTFISSASTAKVDALKNWYFGGNYKF